MILGSDGSFPAPPRFDLGFLAPPWLDSGPLAVRGLDFDFQLALVINFDLLVTPGLHSDQVRST